MKRRKLQGFMKLKVKKNISAVSRPVLFMLTFRLALFLTLFMVVIFLCYVTGNFNNFHDNSLLLILKVIQSTAACSLFVCMALLVQIIIQAVFFHDIRSLFFLILCFISAIIRGICFIFSSTIHVVSNGI